MFSWTLRVQPVAFITQLLHWMLITTAFLVPLLFCVAGSDPFELPKQILVGGIAVIAAALWLLRQILAKEFWLSWSSGLVWWALLVVAAIVSAVFSIHPHTSWLGSHGQEWGSVATIVAFFLLGLVMIQEFGEKQWYRLLSAMTVSSGIASTIFLLGLAKIFILPWKETNVQLFTPVGDVAATAMLAAIALILASAQFFVMGLEDKAESRAKRLHASLRSLMLIVMMAVSLATLAVTGLKALWIVVLVSELLTYAIIVGRANELAKTNRWVVVFGVVVVSLFFLIVPSRWIPQIPPMVFMSWGESTRITEQTVRSAPLLGSGPSTFSIDVSRFHSAQALRETFGILFDRARSTPLTQLATLGVVGGLLWLILVLGDILRRAARVLLMREPNHRWLLVMVISSGWSVTLAAEAVLPATFATQFFFWMLTAGMIAALSTHTPKPIALEHSHRTRIALVSVCCVLALFIPVVSWASYQRLSADREFARSLRSTETLDARRQAIRNAIQAKPSDDVYYRQAGVLEFTKFQEVAGTEKDPAERLRKLRVLARDTIILSRTATELHPKSAANWQSLAGIYQQFTTAVERSEEKALEALEQLRTLEPNSPVHFTDTASIYIAHADREQALGEKANKEAVATALFDADEMLKKALVVDPEFAPARFQSAVILERQGKLVEAIAATETLARNNPQDLPLHLQLGALYLKNNQKDLAEKVWNAVITAKSDYANARWYLANLYQDQQRYADALKQLEEIKKTNSDNAQVTKRIEEVRSLMASGPAPTVEPLTPKIPLPKPEEKK